PAYSRHTPPPDVYPPSLHDALPISARSAGSGLRWSSRHTASPTGGHTAATAAGRHTAAAHITGRHAAAHVAAGHHAHLAFFARGDRKSTRLNSSHVSISYAVFCLKK